MSLIELPDWMNDCLRYYMSAHNRPPNTFELLAWKEAVASVRIERDG